MMGVYQKSSELQPEKDFPTNSETHLSSSPLSDAVTPSSPTTFMSFDSVAIPLKKFYDHGSSEYRFILPEIEADKVDRLSVRIFLVLNIRGVLIDRHVETNLVTNNRPIKAPFVLTFMT